ncbi:hypothetical protein FORMA_18930 [Formosa sp. Hel3_A1_48]|nr:hypothetical protein FORMA_18930 [Formosa sp. Hel3_A1_48]
MYDKPSIKATTRKTVINLIYYKLEIGYKNTKYIYVEDE